MLETVKCEIETLHIFFQEWFNGHLATDHALKTFQEAFSKDFKMISPEGSMQKREEVVQNIKNGWGRLKPIEISISDVQILFENKAVVIATYRECQTRNNIVTNLMSTVVFLKSQAGALQWLFVQETFVKE